MAVVWTELRGVHGHSAHVEPGRDWLLENFSVEPRGWGLDVGVIGHPEGPTAAPTVWVHLTVPSPLEKRLPAKTPPVIANPVTAREVTVFYRTGRGASLIEIRLWDGGRRIKRVRADHGTGQDFSARATPGNTWPVGSALGIGLGVSLWFGFSTGLGPEQAPEREFTVTGVRALFERRGPT